MASADPPLYAYAVVRGDASPPARHGVLDAPVATVSDGDVAVLVSRLKNDRVRAKRRDLLAHSDVLQEAHGNGVVLPLRFGMLFDSEDQLRERLIGPRRDELLSLLDEFDGVAEMRVRATYHDQESVLADVLQDAPEIVRLREHARSQSDLVRLGELVAKRFEHSGRLTRRRSFRASALTHKAPTSTNAMTSSWSSRRRSSFATVRERRSMESSTRSRCGCVISSTSPARGRSRRTAS